MNFYEMATTASALMQADAPGRGRCASCGCLFPLVYVEEVGELVCPACFKMAEAAYRRAERAEPEPPRG